MACPQQNASNLWQCCREHQFWQFWVGILPWTCSKSSCITWFSLWCNNLSFASPHMMKSSWAELQQWRACVWISMSCQCKSFHRDPSHLECLSSNRLDLPCGAVVLTMWSEHPSTNTTTAPNEPTRGGGVVFSPSTLDWPCEIGHMNWVSINGQDEGSKHAKEGWKKLSLLAIN